MDRFIDRWDAVAERYAALITVLAVGWLVLGWASYAGFVRLPNWPLLTGMSAIIAGVVFNAVWWGVLFPRVQQRRKARDLAKSNEKGSLTHG